MKALVNDFNGINFKKVFTVFFVVAAVIGIAFITFVFTSGSDLPTFSRLFERLALTGLRERVFTNPVVAFRYVWISLGIVFNALLALWVYADSKKRQVKTFLWTAFTLLTGVIGWLAYRIFAFDNVRCKPDEYCDNANK